MTAAQQLAELQQRIQALEFSCNQTEKERDAFREQVDWLCTNTITNLTSERDALRAEVEVMLAMMELLARDIGYVSHAGKSPFFVSAKRIGPLKLSDFGFSISCSDTFEWACADAEAINIEQAPTVLKMLDEQGWPAVMQWIKDKRGDVEFIKQVQDQINEDKALRARLAAAEKVVEAARMRAHHRHCEDPWYSCAATEEYIGTDHSGECDCGAERLIQALAAYDAAKGEKTNG